MEQTYGLPPYIRTENFDRAFLTLSQDIQGLWVARYQRPIAPTETIPPSYEVVGPLSHEHETIDEALTCLAYQRENPSE